MRSTSKKGKGKTWPPMLSSTKKNSKRKKSSGLVDPVIKRHKTLPLYDRTNQQNNSKGSYFVQLKISEDLPSKKSESFASIFAVSKRTAPSSHKHVLHTEETLDSDCNQSSQEQEFIPQFHDQPSGTETESNLSNPAESSCSSMDELLYDNSIDENAMIVDSNMSQDKPLTSFPKISKSSSFNLAIAKEQKPSVFGNQNALKASEINSFFDLLPEEILVAIFRYLPLLSREQTSIVCKLWYKISKKNRLLEIFSTDIYGMMVKNMRKHRKHLRKYLELRLQPDISSEMRSTLVDWLIDVAEEFRVQSDTLFLCVRYVDQYLSKIESSIARNRFQLVGVTSLLLASKYEELYVPTIADLTFISDNTYTREEIIAMEGNILNTLSFDITMFTVKQFLQYYLNLLFEDKKIINNKYTQSVTDFSHYLAELSLLSYKLSMQRPDRVASAIILTSLNTAGVGSWPEVMKEETFFTHVDFQDCVEELYNLHNDLGNSPFSAIRSKARFAAHMQVTLPQMRY